MAQFQQMVLDYLVHYQPATYRQLQRERQLLGYVETLVNQLHDETDHLLSVLRTEYPDRPVEYLEPYAEELAIAAILPLSQEPVSTDQEGAIPSTGINTITQASSVTLGATQSNGREA